jgi:long-chain-fatty-acid--[acyl-carrier-protein] ligase
MNNKNIKHRFFRKDFLSICFFSFLFCTFRIIRPLRYKIKIKGEEEFERLDPKKGIIFLINHTALIDFVITFPIFWTKFRMKSLSGDLLYNLPYFKPFRKLAIPIPDFKTSANQMELKLNELQSIFIRVSEDLQKGDNYFICPSGCLKRTGKEYLGGNLAIQYLLAKCPDVNIVLIRTTGLWGSSFSRALTGQTPNLASTLKHGAKTLLKNLIFFAPKRNILIQTEVNPSDFPRFGNKLAVNQYLEKWFNQYPDKSGNISETEPLYLVPYRFW